MTLFRRGSAHNIVSLTVKKVLKRILFIKFMELKSSSPLIASLGSADLAIHQFCLDLALGHQVLQIAARC